ncbi:hypothetical protein VAEU17_230159 [Vibrio aestuarianus]|nr:hypothetical protein VAEU17_230159 [Vibrio aestuarianus]CAH8218038.1 hypothetical protein VAEKB19_4050056 [Vibrio aestuarianus]
MQKYILQLFNIQYQILHIHIYTSHKFATTTQHAVITTKNI